MDDKAARDTQFTGFAKLSQEELAALNSRQWGSLDEYIEAKRQLIAQRAYDLVRHVVEHAMLTGMSLPGYIDKERYVTHVMQTIPDMEAWPEAEEPTPASPPRDQGQAMPTVQVLDLWWSTPDLSIEPRDSTNKTGINYDLGRSLRTWQAISKVEAEQSLSTPPARNTELTEEA